MSFGDHAVFLNSGKNWSLNFWTMQTLTGICIFLVNIAVYMEFKYTSPWIHNLSGSVKSALQTLAAVLYFKNEVTLLVFHHE